MIANNADRIIKLKSVRDKSLAHNDKKFINKDEFQHYDLTIGEIHNLIKLAIEIIKKMDNEILGSAHCLKDPKAFDVKVLMNFLRKNADDYKNKCFECRLKYD